MNALEIVGIILAALIVVPFVMATIRSMVSGVAEAWLPTDVSYYEARAGKEGWLHRILVAIDIATNVILLRGQQDETISTHSYRAKVEGKTWGEAMTVWLNLWQANHGQKAASGDLERAQVRVSVLTQLLK